MSSGATISDHTTFASLLYLYNFQYRSSLSYKICLMYVPATTMATNLFWDDGHLKAGVCKAIPNQWGISNDDKHF